MRAGDPTAAEHHARAALKVAHELGDADVECMALAQLGRAVVRQGRVEEGVALLDEAMTVALGGETSDPLACSDACCTTLVVCDSLADLDRAAPWCEAVVDFTERRRYTPVRAGADGERQPSVAGGADGRSDVVGVSRISDGRRAPIDHAVPAHVGGVVIGVSRLDEATDEAAGLQPGSEGRGEVVIVRAPSRQSSLGASGTSPICTPLSSG